MIKTIAKIIEKSSPFIAKHLGLQPAFVAILLALFSGIFYGFYTMNDGFNRQNEMLRETIHACQATLDSLSNKAMNHEERIGSLEVKYDNLSHKVDNLSVRFAQQEAKMDLISTNIRDISINMMRRR